MHFLDEASAVGSAPALKEVGQLVEGVDSANAGNEGISERTRLELFLVPERCVV